ncbi:MAG: FAD-dependent oxidoreductase, partial [Gammaproteobacteria bacterium]|nr:FAD-dependent oxidoreductase [Gammaproteobacteria bacterium]
LDSLRIEKAYRHWGHDITDEDTPLEAGLGFTVKFDKPGGFIGRDALLRQREQGLQRRLLQFRLLDPEPLLYHNEPVWHRGRILGHVTSGSYGHTLGGSVGLGYVDTSEVQDIGELLEDGFEIEVAGVRIPAEASLRPMYDPDGKRIRN